MTGEVSPSTGRRYPRTWICQVWRVARSSGLIVYRTAFKFFDMGYAAAIGVVGLAVSALVTAVFLWVGQRRTEAA